MTTTDSQTLRLKGPADLVAFVPYALGFHPRESLVLVGLAGTRLVVTARLDIVDATLEVVSSACGTLRRNGATAVAGIIVTDHPDLTSEVQRHVTDAAGHAGLGVRDVLLVTGDRWYLLHNADPESFTRQGNPLETRSTAVDAAAVYAGLTVLPSRDAFAAMFAPVPGRADLAGGLERHHGIRDRAQQDAALPAWEHSAVRALFAAQRTAQDGRMPTDDTVARFGVALRSYSVRDAVWLAVDDGWLAGMQLWVNLARRLPHPYDAAPLFLAGWHAYRQGNGALAGIAADLAITADPGYRAAGLLCEALACSVDPRRLPQLHPVPSRGPDTD